MNAVQTSTWPGTILILGALAILAFVIVAVMATMHEFRKTKVRSQELDELRQLVNRYEKLAENTLDAQQRTAADVAELRARAASIEQILRTVE